MRTFLLVSAACIFALPATPQELRMVQYGKSADFASYKTYQWLPVRGLEKQGVLDDDPRFTADVRLAIGKQLNDKGLQMVTSDADLQVSVMVVSEKVPQVEPSIYAGPPDAVWEFGGPTETVERYNEEGTLFVNLIDAKTQKPVWSAAAAAGNIDKSGDNEKQFGKAADKMFKYYPPEPKQ